MIRRLVILSALAFCVQACAAGSAADGGADRAARGLARNDVITAEELAAHPGLATVAEAVQALRPMWSDRTIYIDDAQYVGSSRDIPLTGVRELRYLNVSQAQMRFGAFVSTPVIHVVLR